MQIEPFEVVGLLGRDFVIYDEVQKPRFEARLLDGSKVLKVIWTRNVPWTPFWLRSVQRLAGGPGSFDRIEGFATDQFANEIDRRLLDESQIENRVMRALGGKWAATIRRLRDGWTDIVVNRIGD